jgi:carboxymuconolactone decarboxylase family protein
MYDLMNLSKMKNLETHAPEAMKAFVAFDKAALAEGAIPRKYKELIALAVAFTTQCPYLHRAPLGQGARDRRVGSGDHRIRTRRCSIARWWRDHPRHTCHEGNLNSMLNSMRITRSPRKEVEHRNVISILL